MDIKTKFNNGDMVWHIHYTQPSYEEICSGCSGRGTIDLDNGEKSKCPVCRKGYESLGYVTKYKSKQWVIDGVLTIGQVRASVTDSPGREGEEIFDNFKPIKATEESYMCVETGIGTGNVYGLDTIFATKEEAEQECKKRNEQPNGEERG